MSENNFEDEFPSTAEDIAVISSFDDKENDHISEVFNNFLLLQPILNYAIHGNDDKQLCREDMCDFRLVCKSWKDTIPKVIEQNGEPFYTVILTEANSTSGAPSVIKSGKILENFVKFLESKATQDTYNGFSLKIYEEVFRFENYDYLVSCLGECSKFLTEMELKVPVDGGSLPCLFPTFLNLAMLRKLTLNLTGVYLQNIPEDEADAVPDASANVPLLLTCLLQQARNLKALHISGCIPPCFQFMKLPSSLSTLHIMPSENPIVLEILVRNRLPELNELLLRYFSSSTYSVTDNSLFQILQNHKKTLKVLSLNDYVYTGPPRVSNNLRFPVMDTLKVLQIHNIYFELETDMASIPTTFPNLTTLTLYDQTVDMLRKWTKGQSAPLVTKLFLEAVDENKTSEDFGNTIPVPKDLLKDMRLTFPNVSELCLRFPGKYSSDLHTIFQEMRQLKRFTLNVVASESVVCSDHWDSAIIGVPLEFLVGLAACPDIWDIVDIKNENVTSIKILSELTYLKLESNTQEDMAPLISDLSFIYGFNGMKNLQHIEFSGRFAVSKEQFESWNKRGRKISCQQIR